jgi:hypothetical protein
MQLPFGPAGAFGTAASAMYPFVRDSNFPGVATSRHAHAQTIRDAYRGAAATGTGFDGLPSTQDLLRRYTPGYNPTPLPQALQQPGQAQAASPPQAPNAQPMSPTPASQPFPSQPNGNSPTNPSPLATLPTRGGFGQSPLQAAMTQAPAAPAVPAPTPPPQPQSQPQATPNFYNGPGSQNFGIAEAAPGAPTGTPTPSPNSANLQSFLQRIGAQPGGLPANPDGSTPSSGLFGQQAQSYAPQGPLGNGLLQKVGNLFGGSLSNSPAAGQWAPSNAWYNNPTGPY